MRPRRPAGFLEEDFSEQLQGDYDVMPDGRVGEKPGAHLIGRQKILRARIVAAIEHKKMAGHDAKGGGRRLPARRGVHDVEPLRRAEDARGARARSGMHHEGRGFLRLRERILRLGARA